MIENATKWKFDGFKNNTRKPKKQYPLNPSNAVAPDPGFVFCQLLRIKEKKHNPGWIDLGLFCVCVWFPRFCVCNSLIFFIYIVG